MIHQFVPMLHRADAVGAHTMALQDLLGARGMASRVFVELEDPATAERTVPYTAYDEIAVEGDLLVYQFATASTVADALVARPERLVVNYHNVTPAEYFVPWDEPLAHHQLWARNQLTMLGTRAVLGVAVSEANRTDLVASGFPSTAVIPPVVPGFAAPGFAAPGPPAPGSPAAGSPAGGSPAGGSPAGAGSGPAAATGSAVARRPPRTEGAKWLAVGRLAPNKSLEATIAALLAYRLCYDPRAVLEVIGRPAVPAYARALRQYAADLGLAEAVVFAGSVDDATLARAYADADVLVVASLHEGFCLPVVEAMASGLPVVAYREGALPEVLGEGGVLLETMDPAVVAAAVGGLQREAAHRRALGDAAAKQLASLDLASSGPRLVDLLLSVHADPLWPAAAGEPAAGPAPQRAGPA